MSSPPPIPRPGLNGMRKGRAIDRSPQPMVSQARSDTARRNGARSKGPTTPEGKSRSRANSLTHSMTGEGVVVTDEVRDEADRTEQALLAELNPRTTLGC